MSDPSGGAAMTGVDARSPEERLTDALTASRIRGDLVAALALRLGGTVDFTAQEWAALQPEGRAVDTLVIRNGTTDEVVLRTVVVHEVGGDRRSPAEEVDRALARLRSGGTLAGGPS